MYVCRPKAGVSPAAAAAAAELDEEQQREKQISEIEVRQGGLLRVERSYCYCIGYCMQSLGSVSCCVAAIISSM
jgi:hypothetical protein